MFRFASLALSLACIFAGCSSDSETSYIFELTIRNTANPGFFTTSAAEPAVVAFSPAIGVIHRDGNPMYRIGQPASAAFELFAEDTDQSDLIESLSTNPMVLLTVLGISPVEEDAQDGALLPESTYRIVFNVEDTAAKLSLVLQYLQSNDVFVGTGSDGIALFDAAGQPLAQDISAQLQFLDAGTEVNQEPGAGADQAIRQLMPGDGASEGGVVGAVNDGFQYPSVAGTLQVTIAPLDTVD